MKAFIMVLFTATALFSERLQVVASMPDLADIAAKIGGDAVNVITLATGKEDLHSVPARPAFLPKLNKADLLLTLGLDAEHAWLPALVKEARNSRICEGGPGWIDCSHGIEILGIPQKLDRSEGEQHPDGNPHYNIGPQCGEIIAINIQKVFANALPSKAELFEKNKNDYCLKIKELISELREKGKSLNGIKIVEYHPDLIYLSHFYGMKIVGTIEPKAGISPSAAHLKKLQKQAKESKVVAVIYNQSQNRRLPEKMANSIGCKPIQIANAVGAKKEISSWIDLQKYNLRKLLEGIAGVQMYE
ncbi:MAG: zinc ABC transporter substrate-binding protein [Fibrobacter sp.]|jgi:zinc/manganese transport system substrate-binding protein|nr:zinc ABC transporter substrate-binding protein [Fibrobacter sp.]